MFEGLFGSDASIIESDIEIRESSDLISTSIDAKVDGVGELAVLLDASAVVTSLSLNNYQVETSDNLGVVTYSIDGFFTLSNSMVIDVLTPTVISVTAVE